LNIRRANAADVPALMELERHDATAAHWSPEQYERMFSPAGDQGSERIVLVVEDCNLVEGIGETPGETSLGKNSTRNVSTMIAFLVANRVGTEREIENIVVAAGARRRGIATRLLGEFMAHARTEHPGSVSLEVRESNLAARALYRKIGFEEVGERRGYYANPTEAAIICSVTIC